MVARRRFSSVLANLLIVGGVLLILAPFVWSLRADILQRRAAESPAEAPARTPSGSAQPIMPRSVIVIAKIGVNAVVVEEHDESDLNRGPMHVAGTGVPGDGNCCIAAHKEKWFHKLPQLLPGDEVHIKADGKDYVYAVTGQRVLPAEEVSVMDPTTNPTITLITCVGPAYFGHGNGRLVVQGVLKETRSSN